MAPSSGKHHYYCTSCRKRVSKELHFCPDCNGPLQVQPEQPSRRKVLRASRAHSNELHAQTTLPLPNTMMSLRSEQVPLNSPFAPPSYMSAQAPYMLAPSPAPPPLAHTHWQSVLPYPPPASHYPLYGMPQGAGRYLPPPSMPDAYQMHIPPPYQWQGTGAQPLGEHPQFQPSAQPSRRARKAAKKEKKQPVRGREDANRVSKALAPSRRLIFRLPDPSELAEVKPAPNRGVLCLTDSEILELRNPPEPLGGPSNQQHGRQPAAKQSGRTIDEWLCPTCSTRSKFSSWIIHNNDNNGHCPYCEALSTFNVSWLAVASIMRVSECQICAARNLNPVSVSIADTSRSVSALESDQTSVRCSDAELAPKQPSEPAKSSLTRALSSQCYQPANSEDTALEECLLLLQRFHL